MHNNNSSEDNKNSLSPGATAARHPHAHLPSHCSPHMLSLAYGHTNVKLEDIRGDTVLDLTRHSDEFIVNTAEKTDTATPETDVPMDVAEETMDVAEETDDNTTGTDDNDQNKAADNSIGLNSCFKCPICIYCATTHADCLAHIVTHGETDAQPIEIPREPTAVTRKAKSRARKPKSWMCKLCSVPFPTREEYWEHRHAHFKPGKRLQCPKCPFVTPFKHHLEYHIANHLGIKPFTCEECSYTCVSKSMLNSHKKSHSEIYQFHCGQCDYKTKYCHSYKLHLRKLQHRVGMVLHPDGTPNPTFVLDVYGTRRGPKRRTTNQKKTKQTKVEHTYPTPQSSPESQSSSTTNTVESTKAKTPEREPHPIRLPNMINEFPQAAAVQRVAGPSGLHFVLHFDYEHLCATRFPLIQLGIFNKEQYDIFRNEIVAQYNYLLNKHSTKTGATTFRPINIETGNATQCNDTESTLPATVASINARTLAEQMPLLRISDITDANNTTAPLDLSSHGGAVRVECPSRGLAALSIHDGDYESPARTKASGTSRRKGKAMKLVRTPIKQEAEDNYETINKTSENIAMPESPPPDNYFCQYCEISFNNEVMHTVHMGHHGYADPFTCNLCGYKATDKVAFFMHLTRAKH